jgi:TusA-related sulfurtransferase
LLIGRARGDDRVAENAAAFIGLERGRGAWGKIPFFCVFWLGNVRSIAHRPSVSRALHCKGRLSMEIHKEVDARGLTCPLPILRAKKALADMTSGQILKVLATDPGSQRDFAAFAKQTGNEIVETSTQDKTFVFLMRRR